ncbi:MAG: hypothetical protein HWD85_06910 [Flavobacteriaceae bacterium]|nr:hypothetical protein [Flavobacteriaceae bacterium]
MKFKSTHILFFLAVAIFFSSCFKKNQTVGSGSGDHEIGQFLSNWKYEFFLNEPNKNAFRMWIPDGVKPRAILVLAPGNASDGTGLVEKTEWRDFAKKEQLALVGVYVASSTEEAIANLLYAIKLISEKNNVDYLIDLPLLLRGHSHGGGFSYSFAAMQSKKTIAYANLKANTPSEAQRLPPGLLIAGEKDEDFRLISMYDAFLKQRALKGVVCHAIEPDGYHGVGSVDTLVRAFFSAILKVRLNSDGTLNTLDETSFYLGNMSTFKTYTYANYPDKKEEASCLIDEDFKLAWEDFVK